MLPKMLKTKHVPLSYILNRKFRGCRAVIGKPDLEKVGDAKRRETFFINRTGLGFGPSSTIMTYAPNAV